MRETPTRSRVMSISRKRRGAFNFHLGQGNPASISDRYARSFSGRFSSMMGNELCRTFNEETLRCVDVSSCIFGRFLAILHVTGMTLRLVVSKSQPSCTRHTPQKSSPTSTTRSLRTFLVQSGRLFPPVLSTAYSGCAFLFPDWPGSFPCGLYVY